MQSVSFSFVDMRKSSWNVSGLFNFPFQFVDFYYIMFHGTLNVSSVFPLSPFAQLDTRGGSEFPWTRVWRPLRPDPKLKKERMMLSILFFFFFGPQLRTPGLPFTTIILERTGIRVHTHTHRQREKESTAWHSESPPATFAVIKFEPSSVCQGLWFCTGASSAKVDNWEVVSASPEPRQQSK